MNEIKPIETLYKGYRFRSRLEARWAVFFDALGVEWEYEPEGFLLPSGKTYLPDFRVKCWGVRGDRPMFKPKDLSSLCQTCVKNPTFNIFNPKLDKVDYEGWVHCCDAILKETDAGQKVFDIIPRTQDFSYCVRCDLFEDYFETHKNNWFWLYIEVKGHMTEYDAERIKEFASGGKIWSADEWPRIKNPVLVVGKIPPQDCSTDSYFCGAYDRMDGIDIYPFNYETIDGDYFGAYPAADKDGNFYLFGDDSNYVNDDDIDRVEAAYDKARQARFEHGERG